MAKPEGVRSRLPESVEPDAAAAAAAAPAVASPFAQPIAELLRERLLAARARWPAIALDDASFFEHLWPPPPAQQRAPRDLTSLAALHLEDLFLACACTKGDRAAFAALEQSVLAHVPSWAARFQGIRSEDVQQELRQKLLLPPAPRLLEYLGRGSLERWVRVAASRCAIDLQRKVKAGGKTDPIDELLAEPDPEIDFVKLHDREALREVLREAVRSLPPEARVLLRFHYLESLSLERLAALQRVHSATIKRRLAEARDEALKLVRKLLRERLKLSDAEGSSLLRLFGSRLDLSLRSAFSISGPPGR